MKKSFWLFLIVPLAIALLAGGIILLKPKNQYAPQGGGIVSLLPSNTEILFELGAGKRIVAVTNYCNWPPEVKNIRKVGDSFAAAVETIYTLRPAVVYMPETVQELKMRLDALNIPNISIPDAKNAAAIFDNIKMIAAREGLNAAPLLEELQKYTAKKPAAKTRVFIALDNGLWTSGGQSFVSDLIEYAGMENIFKDIDAGYFQASLEAVLARKPAIIINIKHRHDEKDYIPNELKKLKVIRLDPDIFARPTPRAVRAIPSLAAKI